ncbi:MAG: hypothetical protein GYA15_12345 [Leptolinea sp.]|jgi:hypothetical protein|nr:hypothetical protein [Leptolinea sp.]
MDDLNSTNQYVITYRPLAAWISAGALVVAAFIMLGSGSTLYIFAGIFFLAALLILALVQTSTTVADRMQRTITVSHQNLFGRKETVIPFNEVADFDIEISRSRSRRGNTTTNYRLTLVKTSGERVPLHKLYNSFYDEKARQAKALSELLNLPGSENRPDNLFQTAMQSQVAATSNPSMAQEGTTSGVNWKIEIHSIGGKPVTRWISEDFTCPGNFLLVSQKPPNSPSLKTGGLLGNLLTMVYQQILGMYGFLPGDTPGFNNASPVVTRDNRFDDNFGTLTNEQGFGQRLLNPWTLTPFVGWAERYPLKTANSTDQVGQLAVLYSPRGVQVAVLGSLPSTETDEVIALGVELVKAQGGGKTTV